MVSRAEQVEIDAGRGENGCVMLDLRHLGKELIFTKLHQIYELAQDLAGVDMLTETVPIRPGMHYQMGGVKTDLDGRSALPGLYAAGECACVSVHGANRLGGKLPAGDGRVRTPRRQDCRAGGSRARSS